MTTSHTPGRLTLFILDRPLADIPAYVDQCIKASGGMDFYFLSADCPDKGQVDVAHIGNGPRGEANARRLVACWNRLEKFSTDDIENHAIDLTGHGALQAENIWLKSQNDELLDALKALHGWCKAETEHFDSTGPDEWIMEKARAAIAKATGGES